VAPTVMGSDRPKVAPLPRMDARTDADSGLWPVCGWLSLVPLIIAPLMFELLFGCVLFVIEVVHPVFEGFFPILQFLLGVT
jgi:hypothetical protein